MQIDNYERKICYHGEMLLLGRKNLGTYCPKTIREETIFAECHLKMFQIMSKTMTG